MMIMIETLHRMTYLGSQNHPLLSCLSLKDLGLVDKNLGQLGKYLGVVGKWWQLFYVVVFIRQKLKINSEQF